MIRRTAVLEHEESPRIRKSNELRQYSYIEVCRNTPHDSNNPVRVFYYKQCARKHIHICNDGRRKDTKHSNCADPAGICEPTSSQQMRPTNAYISHFQQPSLPKI